MKKNLAPLKIKQKKKEKNSELKSQVRSLKENVKSKNEENIFLFKQMNKLKEEKEAIVRTLDAILTDLNWSKMELKQAKVSANYLSFLEKKTRLSLEEEDILRGSRHSYVNEKRENEEIDSLWEDRLVFANV